MIPTVPTVYRSSNSTVGKVHRRTGSKGKKMDRVNGGGNGSGVGKGKEKDKKGPRDGSGCDD